MNRISDIKAAIDHIKSTVDIKTFVSSELGTAQRSSGNDDWWCCPFHSEKTPSFAVHSALRVYHCFGCHVGGDVVKFAQVRWGMSATDAVRALAVKYGVNMSQFERPPTPEEIQHDRYISIMNAAAKICSKQLFANKEVLNSYMAETGFGFDQIADYDVGYSISGDLLIGELFKVVPQVTQTDMDALGFTSRLMWNNAIVYPVKSAVGHTVRFHNKPLTPPSDWGGKYIGNSNRHPLFSHGSLFGMHLLRNQIKNPKSSVRLVEGQKAAIASGGMAILGSSLHEDQINTLQEHNVKEIRVCFDGDDAGRNASVKLLDLVSKMTEMHILVARIQSGKQPDDIYREGGQIALDNVFSNAVLPVQFYVDNHRNDTGEIITQDRFALVNNIKSFLQSLPELHLDMTADYLAKELNVDVFSITSFVKELKLTRTGLVNRDTELAVIRQLLLSPELWSSARQTITDVKAFTTVGYQFVFNAIEGCHRKARDTNGAISVTIQAVRDELNILYPYHNDLPKIVETIITSEPKYEYLDAVHRMIDLWRRRVGIEQSKVFGTMLSDLSKPSGDLVTTFRKQLVSSLEVRKDDINTPLDLATHVMNSIRERMANKSPIVGYDFSSIVDINGEVHECLRALTLTLSGLQKKHQIVISARSGQGKSMLALQMAISLSICPEYEDQVPVLWIPLEMNAEETTFRIISMISGVNNDKVQTGQFTPEEFMRVQRALDKIAKSKFYIKKPKYGHMDEIFSIIDEYKFRYKIEGVFLDYLQLISPGSNDRGLSTHELLSKASKMLKNQVAEGMDVFSVSIAQQNRQGGGDLGDIERVGGAYAISQDADDFIIISQKSEERISEEKGMKGNRVFFVDKRRGGTSDISIDADLDITNYKTLRYVEKCPEHIMGLLHGIKI